MGDILGQLSKMANARAAPAARALHELREAVATRARVLGGANPRWTETEAELEALVERALGAQGELVTERAPARDAASGTLASYLHGLGERLLAQGQDAGTVAATLAELRDGLARRLAAAGAPTGPAREAATLELLNSFPRPYDADDVRRRLRGQDSLPERAVASPAAAPAAPRDAPADARAAAPAAALGAAAAAVRDRLLGDPDAPEPSTATLPPRLQRVLPEG